MWEKVPEGRMRVNSIMLEFARKLRKEQTEAETYLWKYLRNRRFHGLKFKRQFVIKPYIVDFACLSKKTIIELDGSQHLDNIEYDINRTNYLETLGFIVVRFWNNEIFNNLKAVLDKIFNVTLIRPSGTFSQNWEKEI